ncbi:MAG: hypothetical protein M3O62_15630 [Pseudomonadota bacterium]|nr:hypothetical protein [Pseudomonadota bacterium]
MKTSIRTLMLVLCTVAISGCASSPDSEYPLAACTDSCQSHTDGYEWAQRSNLSDDSACVGYPAAFIEGCKDGVVDFRMLQPNSKGI